MRILILTSLMMFTGSIFAGETAKADLAVEKVIKAKFAEAMPDINIKSISSSEIKGLYQVETDRVVLLVTKDGNYFIYGDMFHLPKSGKAVNLSQEWRDEKQAALNPVRKNALANIPKESYLTYAAEGKQKAFITVFTDIDCGYCRKFHQEVPELNKMGIEVRYLAFPRAGKDSDSYKKIVSAWCADNPQDALTKSKNNKKIPEKLCNKSKDVDKHLSLVSDFGINGTPALIKPDGSLLPGYMPAEQLAIELGVKVASKPKVKIVKPDVK